MKQEPVAEIVIHDEGERMGASWTMLKAGYELPAGRYALYTNPAPVQHDMRLKNLQDSHNALAEAHSNVLKENALLEAQNKALLEIVKRIAGWSCGTDDECSECLSCKARAAIAAVEGK